MEVEKKKGSVADRVWALAQPLAEELGLSLWDVQFVKEGADWYLRLTIDKQGGVSIDDCVDMTHAINPVLDEKDLIRGSYQLEVSSPGMDRRLTKPRQFQSMLNAPVRVKLIRPLEDGRRELTGILLRAEDNGEFEVLTDREISCTFQKKECASVNLIDEVWSELKELSDEDLEILENESEEES